MAGILQVRVQEKVQTPHIIRAEVTGRGAERLLKRLSFDLEGGELKRCQGQRRLG